MRNGSNPPHSPCVVLGMVDTSRQARKPACRYHPAVGGAGLIGFMKHLNEFAKASPSFSSQQQEKEGAKHNTSASATVCLFFLSCVRVCGCFLVFTVDSFLKCLGPRQAHQISHVFSTEIACVFRYSKTLILDGQKVRKKQVLMISDLQSSKCSAKSSFIRIVLNSQHFASQRASVFHLKSLRKGVFLDLKVIIIT